MRYFLAVFIPVGFVILVFSILAILTSIAESWTSGAQESLATVVIWWAHYWWMIFIVLLSAGMVAAVVHDAHAPASTPGRAKPARPGDPAAKRKPR